MGCGPQWARATRPTELHPVSVGWPTELHRYSVGWPRSLSGDGQWGVTLLIGLDYWASSQPSEAPRHSWAPRHSVGRPFLGPT
eukprot:1698020-Prymnesium_polylepis.2